MKEYVKWGGGLELFNNFIGTTYATMMGLFPTGWGHYGKMGDRCRGSIANLVGENLNYNMIL